MKYIIVNHMNDLDMLQSQSPSQRKFLYIGFITILIIPVSKQQ